ncbi:MAG: phosphoglucosamine mutase [Phycisphaerae bacterium]|nr:phosphoglucosamine mutase [Phycisphaerae bacterium]
MAEKLIISVSGMRGIVGENLTPQTAVDFGAAFATYLKNLYPQFKRRLVVCIGRDSRPSGSMLKSAVTAGLIACGIDVVDLGIVTTPCVGIMLRKLEAQGGVVITASHNPVAYNGIKLLLDNGIAPPPTEADKIKSLFLEKQFSYVSSIDCGRICRDETTDDVHIEKALALVASERIAQKRFKVVLDSVNGAGGRITKKLLSRLGCEVTAINSEPTGLFAHTPEPTEQNLAGLCEIVQNLKPDIGFAQDPDADRLAIVDENGKYIGEEYTLALAAKYVFGTKKGKAAANLSTSRMIDDIAKINDCEVIRTPVGEANVAKAMLENNCVIGGEGNGGVIDLRVGPIRDSLVGIVLVLQLMVASGKKISELVGDIGGYYMHKDKFAADSAQAQQIIETAKEKFPDAKIDTSDGCRFDLDDGWFHLRTSNTEPVMRFIIEAKDKAVARKYIDAITKIRDKVIS